MEQVRETLPIPLHGNTAPFRRSPYLQLVFILFSGFALANIGVTIFAQSIAPAQPTLNPFLEYMDIFPGQPLGMMEGRGFSCWSNYDYYASSEPACSVTLSSGVFSNIDLSVSQGIIRQITFSLRDDRLKAGDLVLLLGNPNFRAYPHHVFFFWSNLFVNVSTAGRRNAATMRPVWSVSFANT